MTISIFAQTHIFPYITLVEQVVTTGIPAKSNIHAITADEGPYIICIFRFAMVTANGQMVVRNTFCA